MQSRQIIVIHGGTVFSSHEAYISSLKTKNITVDSFKRSTNWKMSLQKELGDSYEVFAPRMPNGDDAVYGEWKIWFERMIPFLSDDVDIIGHSLGALFMVKYLSSECFSKHINRLFLVSAPFEGSNDDPLESFQRTGSIDSLKTQTEKIFLYHSTDDTIVPYAHMEKYRALLPDATVRTFSDRGHFFLKSFPELIEDIRKH